MIMIKTGKYILLAEEPCVARGILFFQWEKMSIFFSLYNTNELPQNISAQSVQPFGRLCATYIYTNVSLFYYYYMYIYLHISWARAETGFVE